MEADYYEEKYQLSKVEKELPFCVAMVGKNNV